MWGLALIALIASISPGVSLDIFSCGSCACFSLFVSLGLWWFSGSGPFCAGCHSLRSQFLRVVWHTLNFSSTSFLLRSALWDALTITGSNFETTRNGTRIIRLVQQKTKTEVTIPILNNNLIALFEKYNYNVPKANEQVLNRYIKNILKDLSETVPSLKEKVPTKLTMKQKDAMRRDKIEPETDLNGNAIVPRYDCVTSHTARRTGITNMYLSHKYTILQMMHVSGHKTQKTFMDYIKLSSEEIADEIASMSKKESDMW